MLKLALVADWLPVFAGAEHVIADFCDIWPDAPIYTTIANYKKIGPLADKDIRTSSLQKWYRILGKHEPLLPWMPRTLEKIDLRGYDVIVSSSHAVGKGIIPPSTAKHICYCHTPMRYAWEMEEQYLHDFHIPKFLRKAVKKRLKYLRRWDLSTAKRTDVFLANSSATQERIKRTYNRDSIILHPPVSDRFYNIPFAKKNKDHTYFLAVGRLVPYKRFDLLVEAANKLQFSLKIVGTGQDASRLKKIAGPTVEFLGFVPDDKLAKLYRGAGALIFPQVEDAGVVPIEAQACGTPIVAFEEGGILDTVEENKTGIFFREQTVDSIKEALDVLDHATFDPNAIRAHAAQFSSKEFKRKLKEIVAYELEK